MLEIGPPILLLFYYEVILEGGTINVVDCSAKSALESSLLSVKYLNIFQKNIRMTNS